jgi:hypothetical protein
VSFLKGKIKQLITNESLKSSQCSKQFLYGGFGENYTACCIVLSYGQDSQDRILKAASNQIVEK